MRRCRNQVKSNSKCSNSSTNIKALHWAALWRAIAGLDLVQLAFQFPPDMSAQNLSGEDIEEAELFHAALRLKQGQLRRAQPRIVFAVLPEFGGRWRRFRGTLDLVRTGRLPAQLRVLSASLRDGEWALQVGSKSREEATEYEPKREETARGAGR
jgi:hypothetical protein